jgi:hypothetical protein
LNEAVLQPSAGHSVQYHIIAREKTIRDATLYGKMIGPKWLYTHV